MDSFRDKRVFISLGLCHKLKLLSSHVSLHRNATTQLSLAAQCTPHVIRYVMYVRDWLEWVRVSCSVAGASSCCHDDTQQQQQPQPRPQLLLLAPALPARHEHANDRIVHAFVFNFTWIRGTYITLIVYVHLLLTVSASSTSAHIPTALPWPKQPTVFVLVRPIWMTWLRWSPIQISNAVYRNVE